MCCFQLSQTILVIYNWRLVLSFLKPVSFAYSASSEGSALCPTRIGREMMPQSLCPVVTSQKIVSKKRAIFCAQHYLGHPPFKPTNQLPNHTTTHPTNHPSHQAKVQAPPGVYPSIDPNHPSRHAHQQRQMEKAKNMTDPTQTEFEVFLCSLCVL